MNKIIALVLTIGVSFILSMSVIAAQPTPYKVICHHTPANQVTLSFQNVQAYNGHLGTPHNTQTFDTNGECVNPTSTPTPTVSPTVSPTITPSVTTTPTVSPSVSPAASPTPVVTKVPEPTQNSSGFAEANHNESKQAQGCSELTPTKVNDVWYTDYRVNGDSASLVLHWGLNSNYPSVNIAYGENVNEWRYGASNVPNNGELTINGLKPHQSYWFQVAYTKGCSVGEYSSPVDP